jgi:asparagine synthase (glutamine-hydrolysing)
LRAGQLSTLWDQLRAHARWRKMSLGWAALSQLLKPLMLETWPWGAERALEARRRLRRRSERSSYPYAPWVRPEFAERIGLAEIIKEAEPQPTMEDHARRMRYALIFTFMHLRGMVWSERTWARYGLSFADPWSDRRLAEFVLAVPQWRIQPVGEYKRIARLAMRGIMPEQVGQSTAKIAPTPLYHRALKDQARDIVLDLLTDSRIAASGYVDDRALRDYYERFVRGGPERPEFWWPLTLEMWLRRILI